MREMVTGSFINVVPIHVSIETALPPSNQAKLSK